MTDIPIIIAGVKIPDSSMAKAATEIVRDTETDLLYHHSRRVFLFGALTGDRKGLSYDAELLYIGAMFHDMGLMDSHASETERFEVDGANAARDFLPTTYRSATSTTFGTRSRFTRRRASLSISDRPSPS